MTRHNIYLLSPAPPPPRIKHVFANNILHYHPPNTAPKKFLAFLQRLIYRTQISSKQVHKFWHDTKDSSLTKQQTRPLTNLSGLSELALSRPAMHALLWKTFSIPTYYLRSTWPIIKYLQKKILKSSLSRISP